jgi:fluoride ion exporter CrcB/FEX
MVLVIALGSVAGALLRQALILAVPRSRDATSGFMLASTMIVGGLIGVAMGIIITTSALALEGPSPWLIGLIAALGTFGASAVVAISASEQQATKRLPLAVVHIVLAIVAAAFGIGFIQWARIANA